MELTIKWDSDSCYVTINGESIAQAMCIKDASDVIKRYLEELERNGH